MSDFVTRVEVVRDTYRDTAALSRLSQALGLLPGVIRGAAVMATRSNLKLLVRLGFAVGDVENLRAEDLVVVVDAHSEADATAALAQADDLLNGGSRAAGQANQLAESEVATIDAALLQTPEASLAIISVPGAFAGREARRAIFAGLHVFLFSGGVSVEEEVELKRLGQDKRRLVMGPECTTAIVDGVPIGFANSVRAGSIGVIGASGTGIQEVTSLIHRRGGGVSQAIGTGGRDLGVKVGGATTLQALALLENDPKTEVLLLVSKPPAGTVAHAVLSRAKATQKPVVACFVGADGTDEDGVVVVPTLDEAARVSCELATAGITSDRPDAQEAVKWKLRPPRFTAWQKDLVGLFSGGTLAYEALSILSRHLDLSSNLRFQGVRPLADAGHRIIDMGEQEFTQSRLHPMIDPELRVQAIRDLGADAQAAVLLLDVVLGHGAHHDPAGALVPAIRHAKQSAKERGGELVVIASVTGTELDPQDRDRQVERLEAAAVIVADSNAQAAEMARNAMGYVPDEEVLVTTDERPMPVLGKPMSVVNVGLTRFAETLQKQSVPVRQVDWRPPAGGDPRLARLLDKLS